MFKPKLHWYMLTYLKVGEQGSSWGVANAYIGRVKQCVTKSDIRSAANFIQCDMELTLQSVSYLGRMTSDEFDGD